MRILSTFLLIICMADAKPKISLETVMQYTETVNENQIEVFIHQGEYDFSQHNLTKEIVSKDGKELIREAAVDGVNFAGTEGMSPFSNQENSLKLITINDIKLTWNGEQISVSKKLHINLVGLTLRRDCIQFIPSPSGEELLIQATGGDGGSSYLVSLVLRKNGMHTQYECSYYENDLPIFPYRIEKTIGKDKEGRLIVEKFNWLPDPDQTNTDQETTVPESKSQLKQKSHSQPKVHSQ